MPTATERGTAMLADVRFASPTVTWEPRALIWSYSSLRWPSAASMTPPAAHRPALLAHSFSAHLCLEERRRVKAKDCSFGEPVGQFVGD